MCPMCLCVSKKRHTIRSKSHIRNYCFQNRPLSILVFFNELRKFINYHLSTIFHFIFKARYFSVKIN